MSVSSPWPKLRRRSLLVAMASLAATLACQLNLGSPERPGPPIQASEAAVASLQQDWSASMASAGSSNHIELRDDEVQLTSLLALQLEKQPGLGVSHPQIYLQPDTLSLYATVERGFVKADVLLNIVPSVAPDGSLSFQVDSADVGSLPVPQALTTNLSSAVNQAFTDMLGSVATGIRVEAVSITADELTLSGSFR